MTDTRDIVSVSALASRVKAQVENLGRVAVLGELGKAGVHSSGHFYADLKDGGAIVGLVAWRDAVARWARIPQQGEQVVVRGVVTTYPLQSKYQIKVDSLEPAGLGVLMQQLEALKQKLLAEGLFAPERKRPLPFLPRRIGLVTSPTGAVVHDMLTRLTTRCPREVILAPTAVQGAGAERQIVAAIWALNRLPFLRRPEVIIVARGGGSFEDLMPFNSEMVARAVAASEVPIVSGVGHEPDFTLCDFAADVRAPTPTAAADRVVPHREELLAGFDGLIARMARALRQMVRRRYERLAHLQRLLPDPQRVLLQTQSRLAQAYGRLVRIGPQRLVRAQDRVDALARVLVAHDPTLPLQRGFALVKRHGIVVRSAQAEAGAIDIMFADGTRKGVLED
jgi:exodeoxyribonuclease VII large subunit